MSTQSSIEWTETTWNPVTGCTKISDGCKHCYAERMATRLQAMGVEKYRERVRPHCSRVRTGRTAQVEKATARVRELDERPVPRIHPCRIYRVGVPYHESSVPAYVSSAHEATGSYPAARPRPDLDTEYLDGHKHRIQSVARPIGEAERIQRPHEISVSRTVTGAITQPGLGRNRLGDRRRRIRTRCPTHEGGLGAGNTRQLPTKRRPVLSSSSGAACLRNRRVACLTTKRGIKCLLSRQSDTMPNTPPRNRCKSAHPKTIHTRKSDRSFARSYGEQGKGSFNTARHSVANKRRNP